MFTLKQPQSKTPTHGTVEKSVTGKIFWQYILSLLSPLKAYSNRNSKLMIKESVCIPLLHAGKIFITKPNTNSELTSKMFDFLGNFSRSLTAFLLFTLKTNTENYMEVLCHPFPLGLTRALNNFRFSFKLQDTGGKIRLKAELRDIL